MPVPYHQYDLDPRFEAGFQIKAADDVEAKILGLHRELGLIRLELLRRKALRARELTGLKYRPDQPRVPAGNSEGGQWTSGGGGGGGAYPDGLDWPDFGAGGTDFSIDSFNWADSGDTGFPAGALVQAGPQDVNRASDATSDRVPEPAARNLDGAATFTEFSDRLKADHEAVKQQLSTAASNGDGETIRAAAIVATRLQIANDAMKDVGRTDYAEAANKPPYGEKTNKCNLYVHDRLSESYGGTQLANADRAQNILRDYVGIPVIWPKYPILAGQWADPNFDIPGWRMLGVGEAPMAGDIMATRVRYSNASGHVGVYVGDIDGIRRVVSAGEFRVMFNDGGYGNHKIFVRRYIGMRR